MNINRRQILKSSSLGALAGILPASGIATAAASASTFVLATGLESDLAFAQGVAAEKIVPFQLNAANYENLVTVLTQLSGKKLFALLEPSSEILLTQAARDAEISIKSQHSIGVPLVAEELHTWAFALGQSIAKSGRSIADAEDLITKDEAAQASSLQSRERLIVVSI